MALQCLINSVKCSTSIAFCQSMNLRTIMKADCLNTVRYRKYKHWVKHSSYIGPGLTWNLDWYQMSSDIWRKMLGWLTMPFIIEQIQWASKLSMAELQTVAILFSITSSSVFLGWPWPVVSLMSSGSYIKIHRGMIFRKWQRHLSTGGFANPFNPLAFMCIRWLHRTLCILQDLKSSSLYFQFHVRLY